MPAFLLPMLLRGFGLVKQAFQALLGLVTRYPLQCGLAVCLIAVAWLWRANNGLRDTIRTERARYAETVANFKKAQADAEALQAHNLARVASIRKPIDERQINALKADRDSAIAGERRLRANVEALRSTTRDPDLSTVMEATCRTYEASGCDGLSAKLKAAQDNTDQLIRLIEAAEQQSLVETSPQ